MSPIAMYYVAACICIGCLGINRKMGFWGFMFASAFLTPAVGLVMVAIAGPMRRPE